MAEIASNSCAAGSQDLNPLDVESQAVLIRQVAQSGGLLGESFEEQAPQYAAWRHSVFERTCAEIPDPSAFLVENPDFLRSFHEREGGTLIVPSHTGCWFATPFAVHQMGLPLTFLMEMADDRLLERCAEIGVEPIEPVPGVTLGLKDGRRIRIPGSSSLKQVMHALENGLTVGMFGDTYRPGGQQETILGQPVELINHYALLAERMGKTILVLRQWTEKEKIHIRFERLTPDTGITKRSDRVRSLVHNFARMLDEDLRERPEQYAYFPNSIFGASHSQKKRSDSD